MLRNVVVAQRNTSSIDIYSILNVLKCLEVLRKNAGTVNDKAVLEGVKVAIDLAKSLIKADNTDYSKLLKIE